MNAQEVATALVGVTKSSSRVSSGNYAHQIPIDEDVDHHVLPENSPVRQGIKTLSRSLSNPNLLARAIINNPIEKEDASSPARKGLKLLTKTLSNTHLLKPIIPDDEAPPAKWPAPDFEGLRKSLTPMPEIKDEARPAKWPAPMPGLRKSITRSLSPPKLGKKKSNSIMRKSISFRLGANKKDTPTYFSLDSTVHSQSKRDNKVGGEDEDDKGHLSSFLNRVEGSYKRNSINTMEAMETIQRASKELDSTMGRIVSHKISKKPKSAMRKSTSIGETMNERGGHSPRRSSYQDRSRRRSRVGISQAALVPKGSGGRSPKRTPTTSGRGGCSSESLALKKQKSTRTVSPMPKTASREKSERGGRSPRRASHQVASSTAQPPLARMRSRSCNPVSRDTSEEKKDRRRRKVSSVSPSAKARKSTSAQEQQPITEEDSRGKSPSSRGQTRTKTSGVEFRSSGRGRSPTNITSLLGSMEIKDIKEPAKQDSQDRRERRRQKRTANNLKRSNSSPKIMTAKDRASSDGGSTRKKSPDKKTLRSVSPMRRSNSSPKLMTAKDRASSDGSTRKKSPTKKTLMKSAPPPPKNGTNLRRSNSSTKLMPLISGHSDGSGGSTRKNSPTKKTLMKSASPPPENGTNLRRSNSSPKLLTASDRSSSDPNHRSTRTMKSSVMADLSLTSSSSHTKRPSSSAARDSLSSSSHHQRMTSLDAATPRKTKGYRYMKSRRVSTGPLRALVEAEKVALEASVPGEDTEEFNQKTNSSKDKDEEPEDESDFNETSEDIIWKSGSNEMRSSTASVVVPFASIPEELLQKEKMMRKGNDSFFKMPFDDAFSDLYDDDLNIGSSDPTKEEARAVA